VHKAITKPIDWCTIKLARLSVRSRTGKRGQAAEVEKLLAHRDFFGDFVTVPADFRVGAQRVFTFTSPVTSPWPRNNTVHGRLFAAGKDWRDRPTVLLLHGWNAELGYRTLFPYLARRLNKAGLNAVIIELPYHRQRKPRGPGAIRNFIADDLMHVVLAVHQSIADARAVVAWLTAQGCPQIGVWGISLGGWLTGLLACVEPRVHVAVLMTPVVRMDRVITDLEFCEPIRRSLGGATVRLEPLNLATHQPLPAPENILIVASEHDLFAPIATIEDLHRTWGQPELWRHRHGHISLMMSAPIMAKTVRWMAGKLPVQLR
jgi:dienelactone hydrolase